MHMMLVMLAGLLLLAVFALFGKLWGPMRPTLR